MPDILEKLSILADDSKYDLACSCGTSNRERRRRGLDGKWLYPVPLASGGYGIMLKTLISNLCSSDCRYCPLRHDGNTPHRCALTPDEVARAFLEYDRRHHLLGLFLSSAITGNPDRTMQMLVDTAEILRYRYRYRGYIHLKIIPGASPAAIYRAIQLSTAVSLNIETPGKNHFAKLSHYKDYLRDIIAPLKFMAEVTAPGAEYAKVKCTTQFIVGASDETDTEIIRYLDGIYNRLRFQRVYFSAYQSGLGNPSIPGEQSFTLTADDRLTREHRLYQADFLIRQYKFQPAEIPFAADGNLDLYQDPKEVWAARNPQFFPVRINGAEREQLLRVPGFGPVTVKRILQHRQHSRIRYISDLHLAGKLARKANPFLDFSG
ncbi:MAG: radical SAM protein [Lentisphaeria bacterium]|jgi:predicted DNA-binding helix-hairpin-helix protein